MRSLRLPLSLLLVSAVVSLGIAQSKIPILDRKITLHSSKERLPELLQLIAKEGGFVFSYNSSIVREDQIASVEADNKTVREVLNEIFKGSMDFKEKGSHLILLKLPVPPQTTVIVSGYVEDAITRQRIADASVYDKKSVTSAVTDEDGYFRMRLDKPGQSAAIAVSKHVYRDTIVTISASGNQYLNISIMPVGTDSVVVNAVSDLADSTMAGTEELSMPYQDEPNVQNINEPMYRDVQISFLPFLGSNGNLSGNIVNDYSINIFGGYSRGTRQIELGFFMNMDRDDVSWMQVAGLGNLVGGNVYGLQASGFCNINGGETKALQLTGFGNVNFHDFQGVQAVGFGNVNLASAQGVQVAGFVNFTGAASRGVQVAGFSNVQTGRYDGTQIAGGSNIATNHITGSQIAGLFNYGRNVHGTQIGLFNFADTLGGVPVGLVSYVNSGYHKLEVSADEIFYANLAFRTGVRKFYNILLAGIKPEQAPDTNVWTFGYGIGMAPRLSRSLQMNLDLTSQHVNKGSFTSELSLLNKVHVGLDFRLTRKFSIYGGVTLNGYLTKTTYSDYPTLFTEYHPRIIYEHNFNNDTNLKMWWGAKVGLRFF